MSREGGRTQLANTGKGMSSNTMQGKLRPGLYPVWRRALDSLPSLGSFGMERVPGGGILAVVQKGACRQLELLATVLASLGTRKS